ncbi:MAG: sensor domain-containing diguanylate cyclase [Candidatus Hydrogenedentota bacterium]
MRVFEILKDLINSKESTYQNNNIDTFLKTLKTDDDFVIYQLPRISHSFIADYLDLQLEIIEKVISYYTGVIYLRNNEGNLGLFSIKGSDNYLKKYVEIESGIGPIGWCYKYGKPLNIPSLKERTRTLYHYKYNPSVKSLICAPLWIGKKSVGVIALDSQNPNAFDDNAVKTLYNFSSAISQFLEMRSKIIDNDSNSRYYYRINTIIQKMLNTEFITTLSKNLFEEIHKLMPYKKGCIFIANEETIKIIDTSGYNDIYSKNVLLKIHTDIAQLSMKNNQVLKYDTNFKSNYLPSLSLSVSSENIEESCIAIPSTCDKLHFSLVLTSNEQYFFEDEDINLLNEILTCFSKCYLNLSKIEAISSASSKNKLKIDILTDLLNITNLKDFSRYLCSKLVEVLKAKSAGVFYLKEENDLKLYYTLGEFPDFLTRTYLPETQAILKSISTSTSFQIIDTSSKQIVVLPLLNNEFLFGAVLLSCDTKRLKLEISRVYKEIIPVFVSSFIKIVETEKLKHKSNTDPLTGIYNRNFFFDELRLQYERSKRTKKEFALLMIDIDNFKYINDTYGHPVGDCVLINVSSNLSSNLRDMDILARYGGEEFIVLLPETTMNEAYQISERIKFCVSSSKTYDLSISISIGIVTSTEANSLDELLKKADKALYTSKQNGKNRITCYK